MRFLCNYKVKEYLGEFIIIPTGDDLFNNRALMSLDSFGYFVISLMKQDITEEEIVQKIMDKYEDSEEDMVNAFHVLRDRLLRKQLIK